MFREISFPPLSSVGQCCIVAADINHTNINKILRPTTPTSHHTAQPQENIRKIKTFSPFLLISQQKSLLKPSVLVGPQDLPLVPPGQEVQPIAAPACTSVQQHCQDKCAAQQVVACSQSPSRGGKILYPFF